MNIFENPFYILGVSPTDHRKKIIAAAEEKAFTLEDSKIAEDARNALLIPEKRLAAELRWFPGTKPTDVSKIIEFISKLKGGKYISQQELDSYTDYEDDNYYYDNYDYEDVELDELNLLMYAFEFQQFKTGLFSDANYEISEKILKISEYFDCISSDDVLYIINSAREEAGFPDIEEPELEHEFNIYRADIIKSIEAKLKALKLEDYIAVINKIASDNNSLIIDDLLDSYELNISHKLEEQKNIILSLLDDVSVDTFQDVLENLSSELQAWHDMSRPLDIANKNRGADNKNLYRQAVEIYNAMASCDGEFLNIFNSNSASLDDRHKIVCSALELANLARKYFPDMTSYFNDSRIEDIKTIQNEIDEVIEQRRKIPDLEAMLGIIKGAVINDLQPLYLNLNINLDALTEHIKLWHNYAMTLIFLNRYIKPEDQAAEIYNAALKASTDFLNSNPGKPEHLKLVIKLMRILKTYLPDIYKSLNDVIIQNIIELELTGSVKNNNINRPHKQELNGLKAAIGIVVLVSLIAVLYSGGCDTKKSNNPAPSLNQTASSRSSRYARRTELKAQLQELKPKIESSEAKIKTMSAELDTLKMSIELGRAVYESQHNEADRLDLNSEIDKYNNYLAEYNTQAELYKQYVKKYNSMVDEYNSLRY